MFQHAETIVKRRMVLLLTEMKMEELILKEKQAAGEMLYPGGYTTCSHCTADAGTGFIYNEIAAGELLPKLDGRRNHLLIFLQGSCQLSYNQYQTCRFAEGEMVLIPRTAQFFGIADEDVRVLDMAFYIPVNECDKLVLQSYYPLCHGMKYDLEPIPVRYPVMVFCDLLVYVLKRGLDCAQLHELKHRELFRYLRGFYSREENAILFHEIVGQALDFRSLVYEILPKATRLDQMIELSGMSRSTFMRRFRKEFNETPYRWMLKQMCLKMAGEFIKPDVTVKDIMVRYGFFSFNNFNRFCRENFGYSPSYLVKTCRDTGRPPQIRNGLQPDIIGVFR